MFSLWICLIALSMIFLKAKFLNKLISTYMEILRPSQRSPKRLKLVAVSPGSKMRKWLIMAVTAAHTLMVRTKSCDDVISHIVKSIEVLTNQRPFSRPIRGQYSPTWAQARARALVQVLVEVWAPWEAGAWLVWGAGADWNMETMEIITQRRQQDWPSLHNLEGHVGRPWFTIQKPTTISIETADQILKLV